LLGGELDLRGYKNLSTLRIPEGSLATPLTDINISDCLKLGQIDRLIRELEAWKLLLEQRKEGKKNPFTGKDETKVITDDEKKEIETKIKKLEEELKNYKDRELKIEEVESKKDKIKFDQEK